MLLILPFLTSSIIFRTESVLNCISWLITSPYFFSTANSVLGNLTQSESPINSTSVLAGSDGVKLEDEMSKRVSNMFLILRAGRKPRDGGELGSGLQEDDHPLTSTLSPNEMTTEDSTLSPDSAETEHLLLNVKNKVPPSVSTESPWHDSEEKTDSTVLDLDGNKDLALDPHKAATTVTPFPSHTPFETEFPTVDFFDTRSRGNELIPPSSPAHELQGHEPTAWAVPNSYEETVPPASEEDTTKPDEYDDDLSTTPPPPPPRNFHPYIPNPFIPAQGKKPPTVHNKLGKSSNVECRLGSVLVNGTCKSQCDMMPNYCFNGGQCFVLEGTGVFCR